MDKLAIEFEGELRSKMIEAKKRTDIIRHALIRCYHDTAVLKLHGG